MRNKVIVFLSAIVMLMNICAVSAFAETAITIALGNATGETGETVEIPISLSENTGFSSLGIEIGYDASALELTGISNVSGVGATVTTAPNYTMNPYNMNWDSIINVTYNGTLAVLSFKIIADKTGDYPVTVDFYKGRYGTYVDGDDVNYDENFMPLNMNYVSGYITVNKATENDPAISVGKVSTDEGISFDINLEADSYDGDIIVGLYSAEGALKALKVCPASEGLSIAFDKGQTGAYIKVMWWESINSMKPVCDAQTVPLQ